MFCTDCSELHKCPCLDIKSISYLALKFEVQRPKLFPSTPVVNPHGPEPTQWELAQGSHISCRICKLHGDLGWPECWKWFCLVANAASRLQNWIVGMARNQLASARATRRAPTLHPPSPAGSTPNTTNRKEDRFCVRGCWPSPVCVQEFKIVCQIGCLTV